MVLSIAILHFLAIAGHQEQELSLYRYPQAGKSFIIPSPPRPNKFVSLLV
jgi:hypothetical protein